MMDSRSERYALDVAAVMAAVSSSHLIGVYLHGSAVLGGFDARRSDVDILVVCDGPMTTTEQSAAAEALREERLPCPARGLELTVITAQVAQHPTAEPAFELHLTTALEDTKVVDGHERDGDPDLVLHIAVCRTAGRLLGSGRPTADAFGPVAADLVSARLAAELRWGIQHASGEYAVLNACRAWRFTEDHAIVSKIAGGQWALDRVRGPDRELIKTALDRQRCIPAAELDQDAVRRFVSHVLSNLT